MFVRRVAWGSSPAASPPTATASIPRPVYSLLAGFCAETIFVFFFLLIILGATDSRVPQGFAPLSIGLTVALINWAGIPITNLSLNPARSTATAVFADGWALQQLWLFWVAPILGGALGGIVYPFLAGQPGSRPAARRPAQARRHGRA